MPIHPASEKSHAHHEAERGVIWTATEGQVVHLGIYALCALTCWLVVPAVYAIYLYLVTRAHVYQLTDQRLIETTGLLLRNTEALELYRVKDVRIEQSLLHRTLGRGCVVLLTSDRSTPTVLLNAVSEPYAVAGLLRERVEHCRVAKGVREVD